VLLKMQHGDRQKGDALLVRMIGERGEHEFLGDFGKAGGR
jgi:hypothetical protein